MMDTQALGAILIIVLAGLILAVWRFSSGRYGKLRPSREATNAYESFRVDPARTYYSSGSYIYPNALMGIDKSWVLESDLWKKRELTGEGMKELVLNMQSRAQEQMAMLHGFEMIDDKGGKIGDWFSILGLNIMVKVTGEKRVVVTTPPTNT
jgi:hypothetical protein